MEHSESSLRFVRSFIYSGIPQILITYEPELLLDRQNAFLEGIRTLKIVSVLKELKASWGRETGNQHAVSSPKLGFGETGYCRVLKVILEGHLTHLCRALESSAENGECAL